jgi:hypothetical protein
MRHLSVWLGSQWPSWCQITPTCWGRTVSKAPRLAGFRIGYGIFPEDIADDLNSRNDAYLWKQWGPVGYRELRKRGVSVREAWNTSKSAHGPWRLSKTPALAIALPLRFFINLGLPTLAPPR